MTNLEVAQELASKSESDLVAIANLTADEIIENWTETAQDSLEAALSSEGVDVSVMCSRKKAPPSV